VYQVPAYTIQSELGEPYIAPGTFSLQNNSIAIKTRVTFVRRTLRNEIARTYRLFIHENIARI